MKKKANIVFFAVFTFFLCFIFGLLIGRHSASGQVMLAKDHFSETQPEPSRTNSTTAPGEIGKININTASETLLQSLPNIGPTLAQRIVEFRQENGDYTSVEDLLLVKGIGQTRLEEIRQYITVGG